MKTFLVRGVPASIQRDGWWLDGGSSGDGGADEPPTSTTADHKWRDRWVLLAALVVLADALLWQVSPGASLAVFGLVVLLAGCALRGGQGWHGVVLGAVLFLPVIEQVQTLSVAFWLAGIVFGGAWVALGSRITVPELLRAGRRMLWLAPAITIVDLTQARPQKPKGTFPSLRALVLGWGVPVGLGLVFAGLFMQANPVFDISLDVFAGFDGVAPGRVIFWLGVAVMIWPMLRLEALRNRLQRAPNPTAQYHAPAIVNAASVRRSLVMFNLIFALQTLSDLTYLWGGVALPQGLSYAEYAHRGAYPLLVTALLAGAFAIIARPFVAQDRALRWVLIGWVAQTVLLVISSGLRLELYIEVYGLTRLRLAAGIWMWVVAMGLCLVILQVVRDRSAGWLLLRAGLMGVLALYGVTFVSFDRTIARYNLSHDVRPDAVYMCRLGSAALPELGHYCRTKGMTGPRPPAVPSDWREWGFRDWRVLRSLAAQEQAKGTAAWPVY